VEEFPGAALLPVPGVPEVPGEVEPGVSSFWLVDGTLEAVQPGRDGLPDCDELPLPLVLALPLPLVPDEPVPELSEPPVLVEPDVDAPEFAEPGVGDWLCPGIPLVVLPPVAPLVPLPLVPLLAPPLAPPAPPPAAPPPAAKAIAVLAVKVAAATIEMTLRFEKMSGIVAIHIFGPYQCQRHRLISVPWRLNAGAHGPRVAIIFLK
jgi:hypothetical protein